MGTSEIVASLVQAVGVAMQQWACELPVIAVWIGGILFAFGHRRRNMKVAMLVMVSCGLSLVTTLVMPVLMHLTYTLFRPSVASGFPSISFVSMGVIVVWACLSAFSTGLLIYAVFVDRPQYGR
jgi:hypothetical protein